MKKIATLTLGCVFALTYSKAQTFSDDFESYTPTTPLLGIQSPVWRTWSSTTGGGAEDVAVVTTDNHTTAGSKSIYFSSTSATGGPQDVILPFSTGAPLTTGQFSFTSWFKVPTGKSAYFNFQGNATMGNMYTLDCFMTTTGAIQIQNSGTIMATGTHPFGAWFELTINANLNSNSWELLINGVSQATWSNTNNQIWGTDIYPADASASFWVDDVEYTVTPYTLPALNAAGNLMNVSNGLVGATRYPAVTVRNLGTGVINSFDLSVTLNGGTPVVQNVTGLTLASMASTIVNITTPFTLVSGPNTFSATISNVNGAGADGDAADDVISTTFTPVIPATGKVVVAEEGTGTWCQWCPRGAVYMDAMNTKYSGAIAPIAVHNSDPMTVTAYDAALGPVIGGSYPSAIVDRLPSIDPSGIETDFLTRIVVAPKAFIVNGATYNSTTRVLNVSVTSTVQATLTGNYKIACVITEDDVTGTASGYNQVNAYSGGASGVMGGFELLANPVPAAQMTYDHVARFISPGFAGISNAPGTSTTVGSVFTWNFSFTLPASYDATQIHIVGLFIDPTGKIDNAGTATITEAVTNGYISGASVGINDVVATEAQISIYPNPSAGQSTVSLNLEKESNVQVAVYTVDGALVGNKNYGMLNGAMLLPVDLTKYDAGMYFINVTIDGNASVLKLIKQ
jgi:type IX secretion system substrate protein/outer membrane protein Omp28